MIIRDLLGNELMTIEADNLRGADLRGADLRDADLQDANLRGADLQDANLRGADLRDADLQDANLRGADLQGANLQDANLRGAKIDDIDAARLSIIQEGDIIGWKKLKGGMICKLLIPSNAPRSNATGRKCRAKFADVLKIYDGDAEVTEGVSQLDRKTAYRVGERVECDRWDENRWNECSGGIHFFITRIEAENY